MPRGTKKWFHQHPNGNRDRGLPLGPDGEAIQVFWAARAQTRVCGKGKGIVTSWIIAPERGNLIKSWRLDHFGRDVAAKVSDLFPNVTEKSVTGPAA